MKPSETRMELLELWSDGKKVGKVLDMDVRRGFSTYALTGGETLVMGTGATSGSFSTRLDSGSGWTPKTGDTITITTDSAGVLYEGALTTVTWDSSGIVSGKWSGSSSPFEPRPAPGLSKGDIEEIIEAHALELWEKRNPGRRPVRA